MRFNTLSRRFSNATLGLLTAGALLVGTPQRATAQADPFLAQRDFIGVIVPQYAYGSTGSGNRLPIVYRATINGLDAFTTYRYISNVELTGTVNTLTGTSTVTAIGAGIQLYIPTSTASPYEYSTTANTNTAGQFGTFTTGAGTAGATSYTGFFSIVTSNNATRFVPGATVVPTIQIATTAGVVVKRLAMNTTTNAIRILGYGTTTSANESTGITGTSAATPRNVVFLYDNTAGTGRPLSSAVVEAINAVVPGTATPITSPPGIASLPSFYNTAAGAWTTVYPNAVTNGVRRIEQRSIADGSIAGYNTDADGNWNIFNAGTTTGNTTTPGGATTIRTISPLDAPLRIASATTSAVPTITSLAPTSATAGSGALTLTVNGTNFQDNTAALNASQVIFNGAIRATTYVSSTQITAAILAGDIVTAGAKTVQVGNPNEGGSLSASTTFTVFAGAPTINVTGTPTAFAATTVGQTSSAQTVTVGGSGLLDDVTITAPTGFQVSTTGINGSYSGAAAIDQATANGGLTTLYIRFAPPGPPATGAFLGNVTVASLSATTQSIAVSGQSLSTKPTTKSTISFGAVTGNSIVVNFSGGNGQKRLLSVRQGAAANFIPVTGTDYVANPVFGAGTPLGAGLDNYVVYAGTGTSVTVTGLGGGTSYFFAVNEYNDDNLAGTANYLTGAANIGTGSQITSIGPPVTYTWAVASGNWTTPASWTPARTSPAVNDVLVFNGAVQAAPLATVNFTPTGTSNTGLVGQVIGQLQFINGVNATLTTDASRQLNIDGGLSGDDFVVDATSTAFFQNTVVNTGVFIFVSSGETGRVRGTVRFDGTVPTASGATSRLIGFNQTGTSGPAADAGIVFTAGAVAIQGRNFSGNLFGDQATFQNGISFEAGARLRQLGGSNAFGVGSPNSVVVFDQAAVYSYEQFGATPASSGRTYPILEINIDPIAAAAASSTATPSLTGSNFIVTGDLRILNATSVSIGTTPFTLQGNLVVNAPTTIGAVTTFTKTGPMTITGTAPVTFTGGSLLSVAGNLDATAGAGVVFANTTTATLGGSGTARFRNLTTGAGNLSLSIPVQVQRLLTLAGGNLVSNNNLTLTANAITGQAMVVNGGAGVVTGAANTVQLYVSPAVNAGLGYRHFASPVAGAPVTSLGNPFYGFFPAIYRYQESLVNATIPANAPVGTTPFDLGWVSTGPVATLAVGAGYSILQPSPTAPSFTGTLNTGSIPLGVTNTASLPGATGSGWNFLGNLYPSPLDADLLMASFPAAVTQSISVWQSQPSVLGAPAAGQYITRTPGGGSTDVSGGASQLLPLGQAFFVRATGAATITMTNAMRPASYVTATHYRAAPDQRPRVVLGLTGQNGEQVTDRAVVLFDERATAGFDNGYDGPKLRNVGAVPSLASVQGADEVAINVLPALTATTTVPLTVTLPAAGTYKLTADALQNVPAGTRVFLLDALTGTRQNLTTNGLYAFTADAAGTQAQRFALVFEPAAAPLAAAAELALAAVTVAPNPSHGAFRLTLPTGLTATAVTVFDNLGRAVARPVLTGATTEISLPTLAAGVYTLRLTTTAGAVTRKLVIE